MSVPNEPGSPPGQFAVHTDATPTTVWWAAFDASHLDEQRGWDPDGIRAERERGRTVWVDVVGLADGDQLAAIGEVFGLHPLVVEDVAHLRQRPKVERYDDYDFIVLRTLWFEEELEAEQVSMVLGAGWLVTFQETPDDPFEPVRKRLREGRTRIRSSGADYLAYTLIDVVVDHYFPALETCGERLEALEERVLTSNDRTIVHQIHGLKQDLLVFRRAAWPMREAISEYQRDPSPRLSKATIGYMRDCYDHAVRVMDFIETYREIASSLLDVYLSMASQRMNEVMKVLTIIATIFIPLTFVVGLYGMNFDPDVSRWNMPELRWAYGYPAVLLVMAAMAAALVVYFRRKGWIGSTER